MFADNNQSNLQMPRDFSAEWNKSQTEIHLCFQATTNKRLYFSGWIRDFPTCIRWEELRRAWTEIFVNSSLVLTLQHAPSPDWELWIHGEGVLIAATLRTKESAISRVSGAVNGSSLDRPIMIVLISVSSCTGTSLTILNNKLINKQNSKVWIYKCSI